MLSCWININSISWKFWTGWFLMQIFKKRFSLHSFSCKCETFHWDLEKTYQRRSFLKITSVNVRTRLIGERKKWKFLHFEQNKNSSFSWKKLGKGVKTAFYMSRRTLWGSFPFIFEFEFRANIMIFAKKTLARQSQLHSTCPQDKFWEILLFQNHILRKNFVS